MCSCYEFNKIFHIVGSAIILILGVALLVSNKSYKLLF